MACEPAIDAKEAAALLNLHPNTVLAFARERKIPAFRMGRVWRFRASALDAWMQAQLNSPSLPPASSHGGNK